MSEAIDFDHYELYEPSPKGVVETRYEQKLLG